MTHSCGVCTKTKAYRVVAEILAKAPNMTTKRLAAKAGMTRTYTARLRNQMERAGCVPARTMHGSAQRHEENARANALRTGGHPIAHTYGVDMPEVQRRRGAAGPAFPIGTLWTADETRRMA